jgi:hypothetical protein
MAQILDGKEVEVEVKFIPFLMVARQASLETLSGSVFQNYSFWFSQTFGYATNIVMDSAKKITNLLKCFSAMVPYEPATTLRYFKINEKNILISMIVFRLSGVVFLDHIFNLVRKWRKTVRNVKKLSGTDKVLCFYVLSWDSLLITEHMLPDQWLSHWHSGVTPMIITTWPGQD